MPEIQHARRDAGQTLSLGEVNATYSWNEATDRIKLPNGLPSPFSGGGAEIQDMYADPNEWCLEIPFAVRHWRNTRKIGVRLINTISAHIIAAYERNNVLIGRR